MTFRVLVVEDEPIAAEAHAATSDRLADFRSPAVAGDGPGGGGVPGRRATTVDLILLDMHLPDGHGLGILRHLRAGGRPTDVIAVTSARDSRWSSTPSPRAWSAT